MSSNTNVRNRNELEGYDFGNVAPPTGYDSDASGFVDLPPGYHVVEVYDYDVEQNKDYRDENQNVVYLNQLRPKLRAPSGTPFAGATAMDFLALPTPGAQMPKLWANRWANFVRALGFQMPKTALVPEGFQLEDIIGKRCKVQIVQQTDKNDQPKLKADGTPQFGVRLFGYHTLSTPVQLAQLAPAGGAPHAPNAAVPAGAAGATAPTGAPAPAAAVQDFEL